MSLYIFFQNDAGKEIDIICLKEGQYFGELALVTHKPRAATVYSKGDCKVAGMQINPS